MSKAPPGIKENILLKPGKRSINTVTAFVFPLLWLLPGTAQAQDEIDRLSGSHKLPEDISPGHAYSDFTDPVGRFMDMLAAGALSDAKTLRPEACATWAAGQNQSARTGKFWVGNTEIDMGHVCGQS